MRATTKQALITAGWFTVLIAVIGGTLIWQRQIRHPKHPVATVTVTSTERIPTVLLLGSTASASQRRQLVAGLQQHSGSQSIIQIAITKAGQLTFKGQLQPHDNRPYLPLNLPAGTPTQQAHWVKVALIHAKAHLHFKHYNLIGYGDGGLTATEYLLQARTTLTPLNLVTIATPFNGVSRKDNTDATTAVQHNHQTAQLAHLVAKRHVLKPTTRVTLIAGNAKGRRLGDGVVPIQSALAGQTIFKDQVNHYQQHVLHTWRASHDQLFSSWRLTNLIQDAID